MHRSHLHAIDPKQEKAAGFALTIRQARRSTAYDGKNQARQGGIIDTETKPYDMLVIDMAGIQNFLYDLLLFFQFHKCNLLSVS